MSLEMSADHVGFKVVKLHLGIDFLGFSPTTSVGGHALAFYEARLHHEYHDAKKAGRVCSVFGLIRNTSI